MEIFWSQLRNHILITKQWDRFFFFFPYHFLLIFSSSLFSFLIGSGSSGGGGGGDGKGGGGGGWGSLLCITPWPMTNLITDNSVLRSHISHKNTTHALSLHQRMFQFVCFLSSESSTIFISKIVKKVLKSFIRTRQSGKESLLYVHTQS